MQFVQPLLTDDQALKTRLAIDLILQDPERFVMTDEERADYERLAVFFGYVATNPLEFVPKGEAARTVKKIVRRVKGPSQPQSRSKRKLKRSQGQQKRDRAARRELARQYNEAREAYEKDRQDLEAYERELQEKFANEPRVMVLRADGVPVMTDIPASMIVPMPEEIGTYIPDSSEQPGGALTDSGEFIPKSQLVLPATVEKQMERESQVTQKRGPDGEEYA